MCQCGYMIEIQMDFKWYMIIKTIAFSFQRFTLNYFSSLVEITIL